MLTARPLAMSIAIASAFLLLWISEQSNAHLRPNLEPQAAYYASGADDRIIAVAKSYLGTPYGNGPGRMTCSKFTRAVYGKTLGVSMSTIPGAQLNEGWQPRHSRKGDELFYDEAGGGSITHVAIYMGHGKIIHASNYFGDVHISYSRYMSYAYVTTRRIR